MLMLVSGMEFGESVNSVIRENGDWRGVLLAVALHVAFSQFRE